MGATVANKIGTDGPTGLPAAREGIALRDLGYAAGDYNIYCQMCERERENCDKRAIRCERCALFLALAHDQGFDRGVREMSALNAPQAAAPGGVAPTPSLVEENKRLREALELISDDYANQDISHVDFRVKAAHVADAALRNGEPG